MPNPFRKKPTRSTPSTDSTAAARKAPAKRARSKTVKRAKSKATPRTIIEIAAKALDDLKAVDVQVLDVRHLTTVTDTMVIASGRSDRHVRAIASSVVEQCK
jgi:BRCT domain type II-containing protein